MATRRFCDRCDQLMEPNDDTPFIRQGVAGEKKLFAHVMVLNEQDHIEQDICHSCKELIVRDGFVVEGKPNVFSPQLATLQASSAMTGGESAPVIEKKAVPFERSKKSK